MFVSKCLDYAQQRGFFEVDRSRMVRLLQIYKYDDVFQWCSKTLSQKLFQGPGMLYDHDTKKPLDCDPTVVRDWAIHLPHLFSNSEAVGFGIAMSHMTYREARNQITAREPGMRFYIDPILDEYLRLTTIDPRTVRVFFAPGDSVSMNRWMIAMPVVLKCRPSETTPDQVRMGLVSQDVMVDSAVGEIDWYIPPLEEVYIYCGDPSDLPDVRLRAPISKVQRLLPERAREQINNTTMSRTNLTNGTPPIPIEHKEGKRRGHDDERSNDAQRTGAQSDVLNHNDMAAGKPVDAGAPEIVNEPSQYNLYINHNRDRPKDEPIRADDWAMGDIELDGDLDVLHTEQLRSRIVQLAPDRTIGQTQLPVPPAYYVEQRVHRVYRAAAAWGIPVGIMQNYSIFTSGVEGKSSVSAIGNKSSGLGGATTSTKSTSWQTWEDTIKSVAETIEQWSVRVLAGMIRNQIAARNQVALQRHLDESLEGFYKKNGTEQEFQEKLSTTVPATTHGHVIKNLTDKRVRNKEAHLAKAEKQWKGEKPPDLIYRLRRSQPVDVIKQLFVENLLTAEATIRILSEQLNIDIGDFEEPESLSKVRKLRNEPEPKPQPVAKKAKKS